MYTFKTLLTMPKIVGTLYLSPLLFSPLSDDVVQVLGKLENSTDIDGSCRLAHQLQDILEAADYRTTQVDNKLTR